VYEKVVNQRNDYLHKISRKYVNNYDLIVTEKLGIQNMIKDHRFNRNIFDASWGKFNMMLSYKAENSGKLHVMVNPKGTSQECSQCGNIVAKTLYNRIHDCKNCGLIIDRDYNASINILNRGIDEIGQGLSKFTPVDMNTSTQSAMDEQVLCMKQEIHVV